MVEAVIGHLIDGAVIEEDNMIQEAQTTQVINDCEFDE